jgi:hypothetical protein
MKLGCLLHKNPKKWGSPNFLKSSLRNDRAAPFSLCAAEFRAPPGRQKMARNPALPGWGGCRRRPVAWTSPPAYGGLTPTRCTSRSARSKDRWGAAASVGATGCRARGLAMIGPGRSRTASGRYGAPAASLPKEPAGPGHLNAAFSSRRIWWRIARPFFAAGVWGARRRHRRSRHRCDAPDPHLAMRSPLRVP